MVALVAIVIVIIVVAAAVALSMGGTNKSNAPALSITSPSSGASIAGPIITVNVSVQNFNIVSKFGQASVPGEGHIHYFMDVSPPTAPNVEAFTAAGTYVASVSTSYEWTNVTPGQHMFSAELVNNNHTPLQPAVVSSVNITVLPPLPPELRITSPIDGASIAGPNVTIGVAVQNFDLVSKFGQASISGEGHIHYFLDVVPPTTPNVDAFTAAGTYAASAAKSYVWTNLSLGLHMFSAELVNNNHTPLQPVVVAFINVTVTAPPPVVTVAITAQNIAFNTSLITVPAGATVKVNLNNLDSGIPHTFSVYTNSAATTPIFVGPAITGVSSTTYTFSAPTTPGTYFFRCDVHPSQMNGSFVVQ
jgi:plastocyanin